MACVRKRRGKYVLDFYDQYGKRHWETVGTIRKAADERLAQRVLEIKGNGFVSLKSRNVNFAEIAAQWLQSREGKIRPSTINQYENHLQNHLLPFFGPVKVWQIDLPRIDAYIRKKQTDMAELARRKTLIESVSDFERAVDAENLQVSQDEKPGARSNAFRTSCASASGIRHRDHQQNADDFGNDSEIRETLKAD
jgi:hypothetical protein